MKSHKSSLKHPRPILLILILSPQATTIAIHIPMEKSMISQLKSKDQNNPLQEEDQNRQNPSHSQNHNTIFLPNVRLQKPQEISSTDENKHGTRPLKDGGDDSDHHVSSVPSAGTGNGDGAGGDGDDDGEDVEENEEEATEWREETEGEG